ncbi:MAG: transcription elongation factor GreA [Hyphomicrobiales bacterium]|nr:transcription elongation factor GreA [Hyphomicrobiales bacterium]
MSSAFTRENDDSEGIDDIGERPVSPHRNLVTPEGLAQIEREMESARVALAKGEQAQNRRAIALAARDLNYWSARRANAELVQPIADKSEVRFGHKVTLKAADGETIVYRIVGEDEADPKKGLIPHVAPLATALMGKEVGEKVEVAHKKATIAAIG